MTTQLRRYQSGNWCIDLMEKPWFIDILTYGIVVLWMLLTYATIQQHGPGPWLITSAVTVLLAGMLLIYNQRIAYLRIGDYIVAGTKEAYEADAELDPEMDHESPEGDGDEGDAE